MEYIRKQEMGLYLQGWFFSDALISDLKKVVHLL